MKLCNAENTFPAAGDMVIKFAADMFVNTPRISQAATVFGDLG